MEPAGCGQERVRQVRRHPEKAEKQITTVGRSIGEASRKTRTIERRLRGVESLASEQAQSLLGDLAEGDAVAEEEGSDGEGDEA